MEKKAFDSFGITLTGLKSVGKKGKIPIAGFIYNGAVKGGIGSPDYKLAKVGGVIVWVYADFSGELNMEGKIGMASHSHKVITFDKEKNSPNASFNSSTTTIKNKRYLELPFINGKFNAKITKGLSIEADVVIGGLRVLNIGGEVKGDLSQKLATKKTLSYGITNPGDDWKWDDGEVCYDGSLGGGAIAFANFLAGVKYKGKLGELDSKIQLNFQYPSQKDIDHLTTGHVGTWYKLQLNKGCINIPSPAGITNEHIKNVRKPISNEELKIVSDENFKYAYLSNRIYDDTSADNNKIENNWQTIDIDENSPNGFKAGLYKKI